VEKEIKSIVSQRIGNRANDEWDIQALLKDINSLFPLPKDITTDTLAALSLGPMTDKLIESARTAYDQKEKDTGPQDLRLLERLVMLRVIDSLWVEHLTTMENMRQQASFAGLQQMKSEDSYKKIGFEQFQLLLDTIQQDVARTIFHVTIRREEDKKVSTPVSRRASADAAGPAKTAPRVSGKKVGRNDPCPCGSGKKYKHCCGK